MDTEPNLSDDVTHTDVGLKNRPRRKSNLAALDRSFFLLMGERSQRRDL